MKRPRPREEPVVLGFMWLSQVMNAFCLTLVIMGVYITSLLHYCDGEILQDNIENRNGLKDARTVAFISLVLSENVRAYSARSFDRPFFENMLGNRWMQGAILLAQLCLVVAVFAPVLSEDVLELRGLQIGGVGWLYALIGPLGTLLACEGCKIITNLQMKSYQKRLERSNIDLQVAVCDVAPATAAKAFSDTVAGTFDIVKVVSSGSIKSANCYKDL